MGFRNHRRFFKKDLKLFNRYALVVGEFNFSEVASKKEWFILAGE